MGKLLENLQRSPSDVRRQRAGLINTGAEMQYRRLIDDLKYKIQNSEDLLERTLDLSPNSINKISVLDEFDANYFIAEDSKAAIELYRLKEKLEILEKRYNYLFGEIKKED